MNRDTRRALYHHVIMAAWGMTTVVLVFIVIILCAELARAKRQGPAQPAPAIPAAAAVLPNQPETAPTSAIKVFFADPQGRGLVAATASIERTDFTVENCRNALNAIIRGPGNDKLTPILPTTTKVRGIYLIEDGHLVIDFAIELEVELRTLKSAALESWLVYGIVNTMAQPELQGNNDSAVRQVTFLIEGSPPRESFPAHVDLSQPVFPDGGWVWSPQES